MASREMKNWKTRKRRFICPWFSFTSFWDQGLKIGLLLHHRQYFPTFHCSTNKSVSPLCPKNILRCARNFLHGSLTTLSVTRILGNFERVFDEFSQFWRRNGRGHERLGRIGPILDVADRLSIPIQFWCWKRMHASIPKFVSIAKWHNFVNCKAPVRFVAAAQKRN